MGSSRERWRQTRERINEAEIACDEKSMDLSEKEIILNAKQERLAAITKDLEVTKGAKVEYMERSNDHRKRILDVQKAIKEERQKRNDLLKVQKEASTRLQELRQSTASCRQSYSEELQTFEAYHHAALEHLESTATGPATPAAASPIPKTQT